MGCSPANRAAGRPQDGCLSRLELLLASLRYDRLGLAAAYGRCASPRTVRSHPRRSRTTLLARAVPRRQRSYGRAACNSVSSRRRHMTSKLTPTRTSSPATQPSRPCSRSTSSRTSAGAETLDVAGEQRNCLGPRGFSGARITKTTPSTEEDPRAAAHSAVRYLRRAKSEHPTQSTCVPGNSTPRPNDAAQLQCVLVRVRHDSADLASPRSTREVVSVEGRSALEALDSRGGDGEFSSCRRPLHAVRASRAAAGRASPALDTSRLETRTLVQ
ncbi:hypothetical protein BD414DRAFT_496801 [Trametes punicea]|nr:hypothetical protein BD414DRAFT_496801 [Trametes punicea]